MGDMTVLTYLENDDCSVEMNVRKLPAGVRVRCARWPRTERNRVSSCDFLAIARRADWNRQHPANVVDTPQWPGRCKPCRWVVGGLISVDNDYYFPVTSRPPGFATLPIVHGRAAARTPPVRGTNATLWSEDNNKISIISVHNVGNCVFTRLKKPDDVRVAVQVGACYVRRVRRLKRETHDGRRKRGINSKKKKKRET